MLDIKAIKLKSLAQVSSAEILSKEQALQRFQVLPGHPLPVVLRLRGDNFYKATDVLINGVETQFTVLSDSVVLSVIPENVLRQKIQSIDVLTDRATFSNFSQFSFEIGPKLELMSGAEKVISQYVKVLLTTPGSDIYDPSLGGGLQKMPGLKMESPYALLTKVARILIRTAEQIRSKDFTLDKPNDEKLQSVEIVSLDFIDGDLTSVEAKIRITTLAQSRLPVALFLGAPNFANESAG